MNFTKEEENKFKTIASSDKLYERLAKSIAPAIFGLDSKSFNVKN